MTTRYTKILSLSGEEGEKVGQDFFLKKKKQQPNITQKTYFLSV